MKDEEEVIGQVHRRTTTGVRTLRMALGLLAVLLLSQAGCKRSAQPRTDFEYTAGGRLLHITALTNGVLRFHYTPVDSMPHPDRGWAIPVVPNPKGNLKVVEKDNHFELSTGRLQVHVLKSDARVLIYDSNGMLLSEDAPPDSEDSLREVRKHIDPDESFYGFGEKTGPLDKHGARMTMWNTDVLAKGPFATNQDPLYESHPFLISLRDKHATGLFLNNTYRSTFDVGRTDPEELTISAAGGDIDYFFFDGPGMPAVLAEFSSLTGRTPLPPLWTLGYHQCRWSYTSAMEVRKLASQFRAKNIPCDAIWLDIDYMNRFQIFTWNRDNFPKPESLITNLASEGFKVVTIIDPGVHSVPGGDYSVYNSGVEGGHFVTLPDGNLYVGEVWPGPAVFPDFTRPATREWWADWVDHWMSFGVQGIWVDMNEPATWKPKTGFPLDTRWDGEGIPTDHRETHNVYGSLMSKATVEGMRRANPDLRPFVLTRAGFSGVQRYAAVWTGDVPGTWAHLADTPAMLLNLSLSGVPFVGSDLGGFTGGNDPELFVRWMQMGAFTPFFRNHAEKFAARKEPWAFGPKVERMVTGAIQMRYQMLPLWYSLFHHHAVTGEPIIRPLVYDPEFMSDPAVRNLSDEYLIGRQLLVAPVLEKGARSRMVYLPAGTWTRLSTGEQILGPDSVIVDAPLDQIPLFARQGAILPSWLLMRYVGEVKPDMLTLDIYPVDNIPETHFQVYDDDGRTMQKKYTVSDLTLKTSSDEIHFTVDRKNTGDFMPSEVHLRLRFHSIADTPKQVLASSGHGELTEVLKEAGEFANRTWSRNAKLNTVEVRVPYMDGTYEVILKR